jgi:hypothetical protein
MTAEETEKFLRYALSMYPNVKMTNQQFGTFVKIWTKEFKDNPRDVVAKAFRQAQSETPDWMPTIPKVKHTMQTIAAQVRTKSPEQEFRDSHCGKTPEEWEQMMSWKQSPEGAQKIQFYKAQFESILNQSLAEA